MSSGIVAALGLLLAAILSVFCIRHHSHEIPIDLLVRSKEALRAAGITNADLGFDGRFAVLRGVEGSPEISARTQQIIREVWGVADVRPETIPRAKEEPPAEVTQVQTRLTEMIKLKNVEFETGSARLTPQGKAILDEVAAVLAGAPAVSVDIGGHTDSQGDADRNLTLSRNRAAAVKAYLAGKKIAASRMTDTGYGQTKPIADNATPEGRKANRRIEFQVRANQ